MPSVLSTMNELLAQQLSTAVYRAHRVITLTNLGLSSEQITPILKQLNENGHTTPIFETDTWQDIAQRANSTESPTVIPNSPSENCECFSKFFFKKFNEWFPSNEEYSNHDRQRLIDNFVGSYLLFRQDDQQEILIHRLLNNINALTQRSINLLEITPDAFRQVGTIVRGQGTEEETPLEIDWNNVAPPYKNDMDLNTITQLLRDDGVNNVKLDRNEKLATQDVQLVLAQLKQKASDSVVIYPLVLELTDLDDAIFTERRPDLTPPPEGKLGAIVRGFDHFVNLIVTYKDGHPNHFAIRDSSKSSRLAAELTKTLTSIFSEAEVTTIQTKISQKVPEKGQMCGDLALHDMEEQLFDQERAVYIDTTQNAEAIRRQTCIALAKELAKSDDQLLATYLAKIPEPPAVQPKKKTLVSQSSRPVVATQQTNKEIIEGKKGILKATVDTKNFSIELTLSDKAADAPDNTEAMQADLHEILAELYNRLQQNHNQKWQTLGDKIIVDVTTKNMSPKTITELKKMIDTSAHFITAETAKSKSSLQFFKQQRKGLTAPTSATESPKDTGPSSSDQKDTRPPSP